METECVSVKFFRRSDYTSRVKYSFRELRGSFRGRKSANIMRIPVREIAALADQRDYPTAGWASGSASLSTFTLIVAVTSRWSFTGTSYSPRIFSGLSSWIFRLSIL